MNSQTRAVSNAYIPKILLNAAGCQVEGDWDQRESELVAAISEAVDKAVIDWPLPQRLDPNLRLVA